MNAMIAHFKDLELVQAILAFFQKKKEHSIYRSEIEGFVVGDWQENIAVMLCIKCEQPFNIDPCEDANLVFCSKKKVMVPQCPHCGASDVET